MILRIDQLVGVMENIRHSCLLSLPLPKCLASSVNVLPLLNVIFPVDYV